MILIHMLVQNVCKAPRLYFSQGDRHIADYELYYVYLNSSHLNPV